MNALIERLRARVAERIAERDALCAELDAVLAIPETEGRDLDATEADAFADLKSRIEIHDADTDALRARIAELEDVAARNARTATLAAEFGNVGGTPAPAVVTRGERTYRPDDASRGVSFMRDLVSARLDGDPDALSRIQSHKAEERAERGEVRAAGTGAFAGLTVPQYLTDMVAPKLRAGRPFANICNSHPLPADGMTVNISRITTGTTAAVQASENASVSETNIDDTLLTVNVRTIAGQQTLSRQAIDRSTGADSIVLDDLSRAYAATLDSGILNDDGTSGTHLGVLSTSSIASVAYTDASPTVAEAYPKLFALVSAIQTGVYAGVSHFVMHPRRFWWFANAVGTSFPFLQVDSAASGERAGSVGTREYGGVVGNIAGVPVVLDGNIPTTWASGAPGAGTEDVIIGVTASECHLWEEAGSPLYITAEQTPAASLGVLFVLYGYSAFTAGRYPGAHGTIAGTGLVTPTFTGA